MIEVKQRNNKKSTASTSGGWIVEKLEIVRNICYNITIRAGTARRAW